MRTKKSCPICSLPTNEAAQYADLSAPKIVVLAAKLDHPQITLGYANRHRRECKVVNPLLSLPQLPESTPTPAIQNPKGWEPGVKWKPGAQEAVITLPPSIDAPQISEAAEYLKSMGFDPAEYDIEPIELSKNEAAWQRNPEDIGEKFTAFTGLAWRAKFRITRKVVSASSSFDLDELVRAIEGALIEEPPTIIAHGETLVVGLADWQAGKRDGGGLKALMARLVKVGHLIVARVRELQLIGRQIECIILAGLGDLVEGCIGFYPSQTFDVELDRRQQLRVARRALTEIVKTVATLGIPMIVTGVPGNHGEQRAGGNKAITGVGDNDDLTILETVAEVFADRSEFSHVSFVIPDDQLFITLDVSGMPTLFTHGHAARGGWAGLWTWFKNQRAHEGTNARLMVCGHYHHRHFEQDGKLAIWQCSALEDESTWVRNALGPVTISGTDTALVSAEYGVRDMQTLS